MRLFAARDQGRARAFYRREGFAEVGEPFFEPKLGLPLIQMRRALP
jgi:hypothetical protein